MRKWKGVLATPDELQFAELVAAGTSGTEALRIIYPERTKKLAYNSLRNLASQWLAKPQVIHNIIEIRDAAARDTIERAVVCTDMIQAGFAAAQLSHDAANMIAAGKTLADVTGFAHAQRRSIDLQYTQAIKDMESKPQGMMEPVKVNLSNLAHNPTDPD